MLAGAGGSGAGILPGFVASGGEDSGGIKSRFELGEEIEVALGTAHLFHRMNAEAVGVVAEGRDFFGQGSVAGEGAFILACDVAVVGDGDDARDGAAGNHREGDHGFEAGGEEGIDGEVTVLLGNMILTPDRPGSTAFGMF